MRRPSLLRLREFTSEALRCRPRIESLHIVIARLVATHDNECNICTREGIRWGERHTHTYTHVRQEETRTRTYMHMMNVPSSFSQSFIHLESLASLHSGKSATSSFSPLCLLSDFPRHEHRHEHERNNSTSILWHWCCIDYKRTFPSLSRRCIHTHVRVRETNA